MQGFSEASDRKIWEFAKVQGFCIVTQDADFPKGSRLSGSPLKVIWLRCGNATTAKVEAILRLGAEVTQELIHNANINCLELY